MNKIELARLELFIIDDKRVPNRRIEESTKALCDIIECFEEDSEIINSTSVLEETLESLQEKLTKKKGELGFGTRLLLSELFYVIDIINVSEKYLSQLTDMEIEIKETIKE